MLFIYLIKWLYVNIIFVFVSITSCALHHGMQSLFTDEPNSFYLYLFVRFPCAFWLKSKFITLRFTSELVGVMHSLSEIPMKKTKWKNIYLTFTSYLGSDFQKLTKNGQWLCDLSPFSSVSLSYLVLDLYMKVQYQLDCLSVNTHMHCTHTHTCTQKHTLGLMAIADCWL